MFAADAQPGLGGRFRVLLLSMPMRELISPAQSETLMLLLATLLSVGGGVWGLKAVGKRGAVGFLLGPLLWLLWRGHVYVTRYDPPTGPFGLGTVSVLPAAGGGV